MHATAAAGRPALAATAPSPARPRITTARRRQSRRARVLALARSQDGVASRRQLYRGGLLRWEVDAELRAGRWMRRGRQTIGVGPEGPTAAWRRAVFEVGADAALDGSTALTAAGLVGFNDIIHVSVSRGARFRRCQGVRVHETRRRQRGDVIREPLPRVAPATATVRAALWAITDREAALVIAMAVQQRVVDPAALWEAVETVRRAPRRNLIRAVARDVISGAESLGELDFARMCRRAGLPEPTRQSVRRTRSGRRYLDCEFVQYRVVVEIDGVGHLAAGSVIDDALRQNDVTLGDSRVLRIPVLGLRLEPNAFLGQVRQLLINAGWNGGGTG